MKKLDLGITRDKFFQDYFERNFYTREKALNANPLTLTDIERLLYAADPCDAAVRFYMHGALPITDYAQPYDDVDGPRFRFIADRVQRLLSDGATMVMNRVDRKIPPIGAVCDQLAGFTGECTVANAYMCFGGCGTFGKHWDTHDVFAIQLHGRKRWRIYGSTFALPLRGQTSLDQKSLCPTTPLFDAELEAGDLLYIPRGWWHEATPLENQTSIHISIGVHTSKYIDYLYWFCKTIAPTLVEARTSMFSRENAATRTGSLVPILAKYLEKEEYLRQFIAQQTVHSMPRNLIQSSE